MAKQYFIADRITSSWKGRVPIVLGVTGHRDIDTANPELIEAIRAQCEILGKNYPNTPFVILSGMAEGADRLVVRIAMDELDAALAAVLPMPRAEYEKDFETTASRAEFTELMTHAFSVSIVATPANDEWKSQGDARNCQYARAGAIVADHAQILFAVWDQTRPVKPGGTGEVVSWFVRGYSPPHYSPYETALSPLDPPEPGRLIIIEPIGHAVSFIEERDHKPAPKPSRRSRCGIILRHIDAYNRDLVANSEAILLSKRYPLVPAGSIRGPGAEFIEGAYNAADGLSIKYANRVRNADIVIYALAMMAVLAFNILDKFPLASWLYLGITLVMTAVWSSISVGRTDNRFLEYRSLAEALRIMYFWQAADVDKPLWLAYLSRHSGVVHWIRHAVRTQEFCKNCLVPRPQKTTDAERQANFELVKEYWVKAQAEWFTRKREQHREHYKVWIWRARMALIGSFIIAAALSLLTILGLVYGDGTGLLSWSTDLANYSNYLQFILGTLAAIGLAARGFVSRRADLELVKQYASQREIFVIALRMLEDTAKSGDPYWTTERILRELGEEALQEQAEWLWLRHSRPFEVPS